MILGCSCFPEPIIWVERDFRLTKGRGGRLENRLSMLRHPRELPQLGVLLESAQGRELISRHGETVVKAAVKERLSSLRDALLTGTEVDLSSLWTHLNQDFALSFARVINATGTVLHTNLGRAPLGQALRVVAAELDGYSALEYDLEQGRRGRRGRAVENRLRWLTGSSNALVVNNCAAAMILLLSAHAKGREVIVSRGELVEIGGGFRIPDILAMSGARLVEVGTTNRTRIADYRAAITDDTALLLTTHSSNFQMVGFTQAPSHDELLALGQEKGVPVAFDLGSGMLTSVVSGEPTVAQAARFPLAAFSGDKLLGGPQCGILLGDFELVEQCRRHPMFRALRCDKVTLALLEETLRRHGAAGVDVPTLSLLNHSVGELQERVGRFLTELLKRSETGITGESVPLRGQVGGGSLPGQTLDSWGLSLFPASGRSAGEWHAALRRGSPAVVARIERSQLILDFKAVFAQDEEALMDRLLEDFT